MMRRAVVQMKSGRLGPVLLEMHREAMAAEYPGEEGRLYAGSGSDALLLRLKMCAIWLQIFSSASRPVIIAGQGGVVCRGDGGVD